jgi:hypothetical protein
MIVCMMVDQSSEYLMASNLRLFVELTSTFADV